MTTTTIRAWDLKVGDKFVLPTGSGTEVVIVEVYQIVDDPGLTEVRYIEAANEDCDVERRYNSWATVEKVVSE